jgi:hypothetical protein
MQKYILRKFQTRYQKNEVVYHPLTILDGGSVGRTDDGYCR